MKKLGVLLVLFVLFSTLEIGAVSALSYTLEDYINFGGDKVLMPVLTYDYSQGGYYFGYWAQARQSFQLTLVFADGTTRTVTEADFTATSITAVDGYYIYLEKLNLDVTNIKSVKWQSFAGSSFTAEYPVLYGGITGIVLNDDNTHTFSISPHSGTDGYVAFAYSDHGTTSYGNGMVLDGQTISGSTYNWNLIHFTKSDVSITYARNTGLTFGAIIAYGEYPFRTVSFHFSDGLTGQPLSNVTVKEGNSTLGIVNDGGSLELPKGQHTLTFEKSGYWSVTKTIDVENDTSVSVVMYPSSAAFKLEGFPAEIKIPENTIYTLTFTLSPITTDATYNTYLSISGLQNLIEVQKDGKVVSPEGGKYYLGDISGSTQVSIKFKAGAVGQHGFTITLESHDAIQSKTYTTSKSVTYHVEPLPFSVQMPSEWQVGQNELRISESSGQSYLLTVVLKDSSGNEVWSDSHAFSPYEAYSFSVNVPSEGSYTLELQWNGQVAVYDITVNPAITLKTKTLTVQKGGEGTIVLHFKNPSSDVQYYTIVVSGGFLPAEIHQSISVAPQTEKDVSIAFAVPDKLTYDAYELQVQVLQGNATVFQDKVAVSISDSGGFSLLGGGSSGNTWLWIGAGGLGLLLLVGLARRR